MRRALALLGFTVVLSLSTSPAHAKAIAVGQSTLTYLPDQVGGNFHTAVIELRNTSRKAVLGVGGQVSVLDENGRLVKTYSPNTVNILPRGRAYFIEEALDLPKPVTRGRLRTRASVEHFRRVRSRKSPVRFSNVVYSRKRDEFAFYECKISGTVRNRFRRRSSLRLAVAGYVDGRLTTGGVASIDKLFPGVPATFEVGFVSPAECPERVNRVKAYPLLDEDQIPPRKRRGG